MLSEERDPLSFLARLVARDKSVGANELVRSCRNSGSSLGTRQASFLFRQSVQAACRAHMTSYSIDFLGVGAALYTEIKQSIWEVTPPFF
jgi:hypothetical protein